MDRMYKKIGRRLLSLVLVTSMLLTGSYLGCLVPFPGAGHGYRQRGQVVQCGQRVGNRPDQ